MCLALKNLDWSLTLLFHGYFNHKYYLQQTLKQHKAHHSQQKPHIYNLQRLLELEQMIHSSYCCIVIMLNSVLHSLGSEWNSTVRNKLCLSNLNVFKIQNHILKAVVSGCKPTFSQKHNGRVFLRDAQQNWSVYNCYSVSSRHTLCSFCFLFSHSKKT